MPKPILQLRIELLHIEPLIWRRIQAPGGYTFWDLHVAIQSAFAWTDTHLHEFRPWGERDGHPRFGMSLDDFDDPPPTALHEPSEVVSVLALGIPDRNKPQRRTQAAPAGRLLDVLDLYARVL